MVVIKRRIIRPKKVEEERIVIEGNEARKLSKLKITALKTYAFDAPEFRLVRINSMRKNSRQLKCVQTSKVSVEFKKSEIVKFRRIKTDELSVQFPNRRSDLAKFRDVQISPVVIKTRKRVKRD